MRAPSADADDGVVLALTDISKRFGHAPALDHVSLAVRRGSVHALVGENGAGKTTLMRIAFGLLSPDRGDVRVADVAAPIRTTADAIAGGLGMVHQHFTNVPAMTVAENVALGGDGRFDRMAAAAQVREIGAKTGLGLDPDAIVAGLSVGAQQRLEIVKALARRARVLILDEPTAVLAPRESEDLLQWLRRFADEDNAVVLITHKLRDALAIAEDVTVLRRGSVVLRAPGRELSERSLATALLGDDEIPKTASPWTADSIAGSTSAMSRSSESISTAPAASTLASATVAHHTIATVEDVGVLDDRGLLVISGATFNVVAGEILGVAAIEGAGQRELLRALAGRCPIVGGRLIVPASVGFIPEDRHRDALVLDFSIWENVALKGAAARRGRVRWRDYRARAARMVHDYDIRGDVRTAVRAFSGGNQQKLVLARELDDNPQLVVAENPTRGLDIRAAAAVRERLRAVAHRGAAVVMYSSDLDEVLTLATRVIVVHAGRVSETPLDRGAVGRAMLGVA